jgi:aminoglycoside 6'-N-acetyltransferase I
VDIVDLAAEGEDAVAQVAALLVDYWPNDAAAWPDMEAAYLEAEDSLEDGRVSRIAVDAKGEVIGWAAAAQQYSHAWELHPLVVRRDTQGQGVGRALVTDVEQHVAALGGLTVFAGADDLDGATTASGRDLFPGVLRHAEALHETRRHPVGFFRQLGYEIIGLIPDANGQGKPDIWLAKRVASWSPEPLEPDEPPE